MKTTDSAALTEVLRFTDYPDFPADIGGITVTGESSGSKFAFRGRPRIADQFCLVLFPDSSGDYWDTDNFTAEYGPGDFLLLKPRVGHIYGDTVNRTLYWAWFTGPVCDALDRSGFLRRCPPILSGADERKQAQFIRLVNAAPPVGKAESLTHFWQVMELLTSLTPWDEMDSASRDSWIQSAMARLADEETVPIEDVARGAGMSYSAFRRRFLQESGVTPHAFRIAVRLDLAEELLRTTGKRIKQIAVETGYGDEFSFSRAFRKRYHVPPSTYRQSPPPFGPPVKTYRRSPTFPLRGPLPPEAVGSKDG